MTPADGPKEVAKEATPPTPECAQRVKAQVLCKALRINTPLEHLSPPVCEKNNLKTNPNNLTYVQKGKPANTNTEKTTQQAAETIS